MEKEKTHLPKKYKKKLIIIIGIILIFILGIVLGSILSSNTTSTSSNKSGYLNLLHTGSQQQSNQSSSLNSQPATNQQSQTPSRQAPSVYFQNYKNNALSPNLSNSVTVYTLKDSFSSEDVKVLASKLGTTTFEADTPDYAAVYNLTDIDKKGSLSFNKKTGAFNYKSYSGVKPSSYTQGQDASQEALAYLSDLGLPSQYLSCPITYQRKPTMNLTFVECHYDWIKLGLPYLNLIGLLNVPETTSLGSLKLGGVTSDSPVDRSIININTGDNGKARPNDFDTATVTIQDGGIIREVDSNLRWIENQQIVSASNIYTPEEALNQFLSHNAKLSLTMPAGEGGFNYSNIYQNNKAEAKEATITDYVLSYLEKPQTSPQKYLTPFYTIRGTAVLSTGYRVRFVQTVPALKDTSYSVDFLTNNTSTKANNTIASALTQLNLKSILSLLNPKAHAKESDARPNLQLKTFMVPTAVPTQSQQLSSNDSEQSNASNNQSDDNNSQCTRSTPGSVNQFIKMNIPGYGDVTLSYNNMHTFYYDSGAVPVSEIQKVKDIFYQQVQEQYVINVAKHLTSDSKNLITNSSTIDDIKSSFPKINRVSNTCPSSISGDHPAPVYNCSEIIHLSSGYIFNKDIAEQIANNVAKQIYDAVQQNQLDSLANKADLFSQRTLFNFQLTLYDLEALSDPRFTGVFSQMCYISGDTPDLFLYSPKKQNVSISLPNFLTYTDPAVTNGNIWNVTAFPNGTVQAAGGLTFPHLYYEYNKAKVNFKEPNTGFAVPYGQWEATVRNSIAANLGLTKAETNRLVVEVKNVLFQLPKSSYLKLSLVVEDEINNKLPLSIYPNPDTLHRIQILVTPVDQQVSIPTPQLKPLSRSGFTAIELGARGR